MTATQNKPFPSHRRAAVVLAGAVLLGHAWLLARLPRGPGPGWQGDAARPLQVRQIVHAPRPAADGAPSADPTATTPPKPRLRAASPTPAAVAPVSPRAEAPAEPQPQADTAPAEDAAAPPTPEPGGLSVPLYATQLPPAATLHYTLRRGAASGSAQLSWQPEGGRYTLQLRGTVVGRQLIAWASQGAIDADGIAPERYAESRRGRELRAVNFQRETGRITFSGPQLEYPLVPGAQDRLSWMLQLAAVLAANPALAQPGQQVALFVVGARGDAEVWTFAAMATESVELLNGTLPGALLLRREPRRPYDTQVHVWLDPARHHLPVRAHLRVAATGDTTQLVLDRLTLP